MTHVPCKSVHFPKTLAIHISTFSFIMALALHFGVRLFVAYAGLEQNRVQRSWSKADWVAIYLRRAFV